MHFWPLLVALVMLNFKSQGIFSGFCCLPHEEYCFCNGALLKTSTHALLRESDCISGSNWQRWFEEAMTSTFGEERRLSPIQKCVGGMLHFGTRWKPIQIPQYPECYWERFDPSSIMHFSLSSAKTQRRTTPSLTSRHSLPLPHSSPRWASGLTLLDF